MKKYWAKAYKVAKEPAVRPVEIWAIRAIIGFVCIKLGIDIKAVLH